MRATLIRFLLGMGLCLSYLITVLSHRPLLGIPIFQNQIFLVAFYALSFLSSLSLALGYQTRLSGTLTLILHFFWPDANGVKYGWGLLAEPLLVFVILGTFDQIRSDWTRRGLQIVLCAIFVFVTLGQLTDSPWIDTNAVARYLHFSWVTRIFGFNPGLVPLAEIIGGFAWVAQLVAPGLLWHRRIGKYLAIILIGLHGCLVFLMPPAFQNYLVMISLLLFIPDEWLTLDRSFWVSELSELRLAARGFGFFLLTTVMLTTIFDRNIAEQFDIFEKIGSRRIEKAYEIVTNPFVGVGNLILFNSIWKMYSPTWRHVVWIEWYYKQADGTTVNWPLENFSPDYRMHRRTWLEAIWTDFKQEKVFIGQLSGEAERTAYGKYLCHVVHTATGTKPLLVYPEVFSFDIRGPEEPWSLASQAFESRRKREEIACD